jgi:predicted phage baseplate assembly protein
MALISPILDDRTYQQLRDELVARIPSHTSEWTDHNESDPGIALLELFAFLGESVLYRLNQIPETTRIEFLRLLGVRRRAALPAGALLAATTAAPRGVAVPPHTEANAGAVTFETVGATHVWPLTAVAVGKTVAPDPPVGDTGEQDRRDDALARAHLTAEEAVFYESTVLLADPTAPEATVLDVATTVDQALWIAVLRQETTDLSLLPGRSLFLGLAFDDAIERPFALQDLGVDPDPPDAQEYAVSELTREPPPMLWRLWNGVQRDPAAPAFTTLAVGDDSTRGLTRTGVVELILPPGLPPTEAIAEPAGAVESPPPLTDEEQAAAVVAWIQVMRPATDHLNDPIRRLRWVGLNAVAVEQARTAPLELLGSGTGDSDQRYPLTHTSVLPGTTRVQVEEPGGWRDWTEVDSALVSEPSDRHFTVDHEAGAVEFVGLKVPQLGERIRVVEHRFGGGVVGNVPAKAITKLAGVGGVDVLNPLPAAGGADAAGLDEALEDIPRDVHRRDRCVVAEDFTEMALRVGGVGRAETLTNLHPDHPTVRAAGVVSVVVFPEFDLTSPAAPLPGLDLLRRVAGFLDVRRLATTELYVVPPTYVPMAASVGLSVTRGYQVDAVRGWVDKILRQYLAAVPPDGPDGTGWPLGRTVRAAELEAVAVQVEGVDYVVGSTLARMRDEIAEPLPEIALEKWEVPSLVSLTVRAGDPLPPGLPAQPAPTGKVPVPLPPEVC